MAWAMSARSTAPADCSLRKDWRLLPARDCLSAATAGALNFAATLALSLLFASAQAQAIECPKAPDIAVRVNAMHGEIAQNSSIGIEEIRRLAGPDIVARHYPLLGMIGTAVAVRIATDVDISQGDDGSFCGTPKAINVHVGFTDRVAFVAREAAADACLYQEILSHQLRHASIDDEALDTFAPVLSQRLRVFALSMSPISVANPAAARANVKKSAEVAIDTLMETFKADRRSLHRAFDSRDELDRIRTACGARGVGLIDETPPGLY